jgi:hypothetical protein
MVGAARLAHALPEDGHWLIGLFWRISRRAWSRVGVGAEKGMWCIDVEVVDVNAETSAIRKDRI